MTRKPPAPDPHKAIAYLRCSTDRQDLSPDAQRHAITLWAVSEHVEIVAWHEDRGISGGAELEDRPGLTAAVADLGLLRAGVLVVAKRDRLARDVLTAALVERLAERSGARIVSADGTGNGDTPEAALLRSMIDAFAAYERALIRSRTKAALAVKKARGERVGGIPYGWRLASDGKHVEEDPGEQVIVARALELRAEGMSLRAVGRALAEEGHAPRNGKRWHVQVVARLTGGPVSENRSNGRVDLPCRSKLRPGHPAPPL